MDNKESFQVVKETCMSQNKSILQFKAIMRDPRFDEFLETVNFSFAERLMDFCIKNCTLSRWEDFERYKVFFFPASYPFNRAELGFKKNHVNVFLRMDANTDVNEMSELLTSKLGLRPEIRTQSGDSMTALHPKFETEEECAALIKWLSEEVAKQRAIDFSWEPIHLELVDHLRNYESRQDELLRVIKLMQAEELPTISLEDNAEGTLELAELDPFTFIGNMNRPIKDSYKIRMWEIIKERNPIVRTMIPRTEAMSTFSNRSEPYKVEIMSDTPEQDEFPLYFQKNAIRGRRYGGRTGVVPENAFFAKMPAGLDLFDLGASLVTRESVDRTEQSLQQEEHPVPLNTLPVKHFA